MPCDMIRVWLPVLLFFFFFTDVQKSMVEGPRAESPDLFTEMTDKDQTVSVTPESKLSISSPPVKRKKQQRKRLSLRGRSLEADFESYLYKNLERVSLEHPEWSTKMVEKYILREWNEMDNLLKSK